MFKGWRERLEQLLADLTPQPDSHEQATRLHGALVDLKVGLQSMQAALIATQREMAREQQQLADAERRGRLAGEINDAETVQVAQDFADRHRERLVVLQRKLAVQGDEIAMAQRDVTELTRRMREAKIGIEDDGTLSSVKQAWRELEAAGGAHPETDLEGELLEADLKRHAREAAVEEQLAHLKRKLGRD